MASRQEMIKALQLKEEAKHQDRMKKLAERLALEEMKNKPLTKEDAGISELLLMVEEAAKKNEVTKEKLLDFVLKESLSSTAKLVWRKARSPKTKVKVARTPKK